MNKKKTNKKYKCKTIGIKNIDRTAKAVNVPNKLEFRL